jgi:hypothetical protein
MTKYKIHIIWALVAVVALVGGIFWGKSMASSGAGARGLAGNFASSTRGGFAGRAGGAGAAAGSFITGQVSSIGSSSLTLQLANGNSEVVFYSSATTVTEPTTVSVSKLTAGSNVVITGTTNSDGSVTASSIQVANGNSLFRAGGGAAAGGQSTSTAGGQ